MKGKAGYKFNINGTARYISGRYGSIADDPHTAIQKEYHELFLYILLCTTHGNYLTHMTMKYLNELLPASNFLRVHRSYMVNRSFVDRIDRNALTIDGGEIPVGESYRSAVDSTKW